MVVTERESVSVVALELRAVVVAETIGEAGCKRAVDGGGGGGDGGLEMFLDSRSSAADRSTCAARAASIKVRYGTLQSLAYPG